MFVDNNLGRVGVGTGSPGYKFHVNSGTANTVALFESTDASGYIAMKDNTGAILLRNAGDNFTISTGYDTDLTGGSEALRIDNAGNVGIGTSSPSAKLSVIDEKHSFFGSG